MGVRIMGALVPQDDLPEIPVRVSPTTSAIQLEAKTPAEIYFLKKIFRQESNDGANTATSNAGAVGPGQILPKTFASVADRGWDIGNAYHSARASARYALEQFRKANGNERLAAAAYYGGPDEIDKARNGQATKDPRNPKAPNTLQYGEQVANRNVTKLVPEDDLPGASTPQVVDPEVVKMAANPDVQYEELLTAIRQGDPSAQERFADFARNTFKPGNDFVKHSEAIQQKLQSDIAKLPTPSLGTTMTNESKTYRPPLKDAAAIYERQRRGKEAAQESFGEHFNKVAGYTADQFLKGGRNIVDMAEYLAAPAQVPVNKAIRKYQDMVGIPGLDEVLRKKVPGYNTIRESLIGNRSAQDIFLPIKSRSEIAASYDQRQKDNEKESELFQPYLENSGVGGFFGPMPVYAASQLLAGPVVKSALTGVSNVISGTTSGALNATGRGIKKTAEVVQKRHVPILSDMVEKAKSNYGEKVLDYIGNVKNASKLPISPLHEGIASNAANTMALSVLESANRPDEDWKQGVVSGVGANLISKGLRGVVSELPSTVSPKNVEAINRLKRLGYEPDAGLLSGSKAIQEEIQGLKNDKVWGPRVQPFVDRQNDVKTKVVLKAMGMPKTVQPGMSSSQWEKFWGKEGLGGEMDFRDANTSASFKPTYQKQLSDMLANLKHDSLPGSPEAYKIGKQLYQNLTDASNPTSSVGPRLPVIATKDMKRILQKFNGTIAAASSSNSIGLRNAVPDLKAMSKVLDDMINDVQVPKGLTSPTGHPFDADYIKDLNRRYAIASNINDNALNLDGSINPNKLVNAISGDPAMLKRSLRGQGDEAQKDLNALAQVIQLEKRGSHSSLEGSPIASTSKKTDAESHFGKLPKDYVPSVTDVFRGNMHMRGIPSTTGLLGYVHPSLAMKNDRGLYTPYTTGRMLTAGSGHSKSIVDFLEREYDAYDKLSNKDSTDYTDYLYGKLGENTYNLVHNEPPMKKLGTLAKQIPYTGAYTISELIDYLEGKKKKKSN